MIGRKKEINELEELYNSGKCELVTIYGRRRVGKTFLVDEVFSDRITFRHAGLSPADKENSDLKNQLTNFYYSLITQGMKGIKVPKSWMEALYLLQKFLMDKDDGTRQLVWIDELPWLDGRKSGFLTAFEAFWNNFACHRKNLMVIVCGSANSWILNKLIHNHGGLYGRVTYQIKLEPFTLKECEDFLLEKGINESRYDICSAYMSVGGIPYYLGYFKREKSVAQNINDIFFRKNAPLKNEYNDLFSSIFTSPEQIKEIVKALSKRNVGYTKEEITKELNMKDGGTLTDQLNTLIASDFIVKYRPFGKKQRYRYKLVDPFCKFYLHFVSEKEINETYYLDSNTSPSVVTWRGFAFENVCFNHIWQIKNALSINGILTEESSWSKSDDERGSQIDLLIERKDNVVNMCEIKYCNKDFTVDKGYFKILLQRQDILQQELPKKCSVQNVLITTMGLKYNEYSSIFQNVITLDDLFI